MQHQEPTGSRLESLRKLYEDIVQKNESLTREMSLIRERNVLPAQSAVSFGPPSASISRLPFPSPPKPDMLALGDTTRDLISITPPVSVGENDLRLSNDETMLQLELQKERARRIQAEQLKQSLEIALKASSQPQSVVVAMDTEPQQPTDRRLSGTRPAITVRPLAKSASDSPDYGINNTMQHAMDTIQQPELPRQDSTPAVVGTIEQNVFHARLNGSHTAIESNKQDGATAALFQELSEVRAERDSYRALVDEKAASVHHLQSKWKAAVDEIATIKADSQRTTAQLRACEMALHRLSTENELLKARLRARDESNPDASSSSHSHAASTLVASGPAEVDILQADNRALLQTLQEADAQVQKLSRALEVAEERERELQQKLEDKDASAEGTFQENRKLRAEVARLTRLLEQKSIALEASKAPRPPRAVSSEAVTTPVVIPQQQPSPSSSHAAPLPSLTAASTTTTAALSSASSIVTSRSASEDVTHAAARRSAPSLHDAPSFRQKQTEPLRIANHRKVMAALSTVFFAGPQNQERLSHYKHALAEAASGHVVIGIFASGNRSTRSVAGLYRVMETDEQATDAAGHISSSGCDPSTLLATRLVGSGPSVITTHSALCALKFDTAAKDFKVIGVQGTVPATADAICLDPSEAPAMTVPASRRPSSQHAALG